MTTVRWFCGSAGVDDQVTRSRTAGIIGAVAPWERHQLSSGGLQSSSAGDQDLGALGVELLKHPTIIEKVRFND